MANSRTVLQRFNLLLNGVSKLGVARSVTPPDVAVQVARYRGAGMDGSLPVDMGIAEMMFGFELYDYDPAVLENLGFRSGQQYRLEARAALEPQSGAVALRVFRAAGMLTRVSPGQLVADDGAGNFPVLTGEVDCTFYSEHHAGKELAYIDLINNVRRIGGTDRAEPLRSVLGGASTGGSPQLSPDLASFIT